MDGFSVVFYETASGERPAEEFLDRLTLKQRAKTVRDIELLKTYGNVLRAPTSKFLKDGIFELRTKQGSSISRILYFFFIGKQIVLTNGFIKKTMRTPTREIELARHYKKDFEERSNYNEDI